MLGSLVVVDTQSLYSSILLSQHELNNKRKEEKVEQIDLSSSGFSLLVENDSAQRLVLNSGKEINTTNVTVLPKEIYSPPTTISLSSSNYLCSHPSALKNKFGFVYSTTSLNLPCLSSSMARISRHRIHQVTMPLHMVVMLPAMISPVILSMNSIFFLPFCSQHSSPAGWEAGQYLIFIYLYLSRLDFENIFIFAKELSRQYRLLPYIPHPISLIINILHQLLLTS